MGDYSSFLDPAHFDPSQYDPSSIDSPVQPADLTPPLTDGPPAQGDGFDLPHTAPDDHPPYDAHQFQESHDHRLRFGAGACSHCGGTGRTRWISSQTDEPCWYCDGSGVAP
ncbi:hypothetical protein ACFV5G_17695 [Streptomyces sp. NPDC059766]|uniref:hypothetical protein n=1 Tax=Streptomyces sp. NPDC059766 TaxID=3346940 RepID=UPI00364C638D